MYLLNNSFNKQEDSNQSFLNIKVMDYSNNTPPNNHSFFKEQWMDPIICRSFLYLAPPRWLSWCYPETKMFLSISVYIGFSEVNESCLAADNSVLQLLIIISSLKFLFTVSSKDRKKSMLKRKQWSKILKKWTITKENPFEGGGGSGLFKGLGALFWIHRM